jgi:DNA invertase Pin-like site-specific DNA recombinase
MPELKVTRAHLERDAYLYIRQSTPRQVIENTESTRRQYALREQALVYGWPLERIHVIDSDQGKTGSHAKLRDGFQHLVSEVALGKAGIVMGLEVSRLARNSADWQRLIELCAWGGTLILDQDGTYDPSNFNDRLLLGIKGTMSEVELHTLKARMRGGVLNKAHRGELQMAPPVGLSYQSDGALTVDPDTEVQAALRLVFETFERTGSAMQTVRMFIEEGLRFPRRIRCGENKGELLWATPRHSRLLQVLHNPRYAGAFVYGRTRTRQQPDGKSTVAKVAQAEWQYVIPEMHVGYIGWEQFLANQKRLAQNALGYGQARRFGPAREGPALLQGRVLCGLCGERMGVHYSQEHQAIVPNYVCQEDSVRVGARICQRVPGAVVDQAINTLLLELMTPMTVEVALAVQQEIEARIGETDALRRGQLERARYEAELARRRYMKADPDNRLVVNSLEADWNNKLRAHVAEQEDYERQTEKQRRLIDAETRQKLVSLAEDFPRIWNDPGVQPRERKRILRLLIEDVTLVKADTITANVRLRGGATRTLTLARPMPIAQIRKTKPQVIAAVDQLLDSYCDREVANVLNERGYQTYQNVPFDAAKVAWIREAYGLKSRYHRLRAKGLLTATEIRGQLEVSLYTVHSWGRQGLLRKHCYGNRDRCLYEPLGDIIPVKGSGGEPTTFRRVANSTSPA